MKFRARFTSKTKKSQRFQNFNDWSKVCKREVPTSRVHEVGDERRRRTHRRVPQAAIRLGTIVVVCLPGRSSARWAPVPFIIFLGEGPGSRLDASERPRSFLRIAGINGRARKLASLYVRV